MAVDARLNMSHHCTLIANRANFILRYIMRILVSRSKEATVLFYWEGSAEVKQVVQGGYEVCPRGFQCYVRQNYS